MNLLYIALGGALGSVCRYGLSVWVQDILPGRFPLGTLSVNILGALVIGFLYGLFVSQGLLDEKLRFLLFVGFLGGFTTYSSFALENLVLVQSGAWMTAAAYILATNILGLLAAFLGHWVAAWVK